MNDKIEQFKNKAMKIFGSDFVGVVSDLGARQVAVATAEPDMGENVPAKNYDAVQAAASEIFGRRACVMPFPVKGRLTYVVAGVGR